MTGTIIEMRTPCPECLLPFTTEEWDVRHSASDGADVHEECCDVCHGDDSDHRRCVGILIVPKDLNFTDEGAEESAAGLIREMCKPIDPNAPPSGCFFA